MSEPSSGQIISSHLLKLVFGRGVLNHFGDAGLQRPLMKGRFRLLQRRPECSQPCLPLNPQSLAISRPLSS